MKNIVVAFGFGILFQYLISSYFFKLNNPLTLDKKEITKVCDSKSENLKSSNLKDGDELQNPAASSEDLKINSKSELEGQNVVAANGAMLEDQTKLSVSNSNKKIISMFKKIIHERRATELEESDLDLISNVLSEPAISFVKASELSTNAQMGKLNGVFQGYLYILNSKTKELEARKATIDVETQKSSDKPIMGKYKIEVENYGTSSGDGGFPGFRQSSKGYMIQFGPNRFLHVLSLDQEFKANVYDKDDLAGYATLKRIR